MSTINNDFIQAEFALAAYGTFGVGVIPLEILTGNDVGMSASQAEQFSATYRVAAQYTDASTGLSATVFQDSSGNKYLAIRGTEASGTDLTADGLLALGLPSSLNPQFVALKTQIDAWLADGTLGDAFTVSGHSLGGYLAAAVAQSYTQVTDAYLFNAPGVGGLAGNLADALTSVLGLSGAPTGNIWNVRGSEGFPLISGLGYQLGTSISIQTEAADNPLNNHSIIALTDALAIQALYSKLAPSLGEEQLNALVDASGNPMSQTLESALDAMRRILLGPATGQTAAGDRNAFYANLYVLQSSTAYTSLVDKVQLTLLTNMFASDITAQAEGNDAQALATRYALAALNPFVLTGADYSGFNTQGELNLYDPAAGTGAISAQYLRDRAAFLERKMWFSTEDKNPVDPSVVDDPNNHRFQNESAYYEDVTLGFKIQQGGLFNNTHHYFFGGDGADTHIGSLVEDHLYGGDGADTLTGNKGNDYLEGGKGFDTYLINPNDGHDTLLDTDGAGVIKFGDIEATGSAIEGLDLAKWVHAPGSDTWIDQQNGITYTRSVVDGETRLLVKHGDNTVLVRGWDENELGITLGEGAVVAPSAPTLAGGDADEYISDDIYVRGANASTSSAVNGAGQNPGYTGLASDGVIAGGGGRDVVDAGAGNDHCSGRRTAYTKTTGATRWPIAATR